MPPHLLGTLAYLSGFVNTKTQTKRRGALPRRRRGAGNGRLAAARPIILSSPPSARRRRGAGNGRLAAARPITLSSPPSARRRRGAGPKGRVPRLRRAAACGGQLRPRRGHSRCPVASKQRYGPQMTHYSDSGHTVDSRCSRQISALTPLMLGVCHFRSPIIPGVGMKLAQPHEASELTPGSVRSGAPGRDCGCEPISRFV